jgi:hypothetical protein
MSNHRFLLTNIVCLLSLILALGSYLRQETQQETQELTPQDLVVMYAKTRMELAQAEIEWANQSSGGVLPQRYIERRSSDLAIAKEHYKQAMLASTGGIEKIRLCYAEESVRLARLDLERATRLGQKDTIREIVIKRAQLKYKLAELKLAMLKNPENYVTFMEAMQAQIDRVEQDVLAIDSRILKLEKQPTINN